MKRLISVAIGAGFILGSIIYLNAQVVPQPGPPVPIACAYNTSPVTLTNGQSGWVQCDNAGRLQSTATFTPSGTQDVNLLQVGGVATAVNNGTASTGTQRVTIASDNTAFATLPTPSSAAAQATTSASSTAAGSNLVLKASAGNLYALTTTIGATSGYLLLFDATSLPANGAVTPVYCAPIDSNGTNGMLALQFLPPKRFGTGITAGFSTTGCFTLTASATASFFGGYQ